jgi:hypothetical protein
MTFLLLGNRLLAAFQFIPPFGKSILKGRERGEGQRAPADSKISANGGMREASEKDEDGTRWGSNGD